MESKSVLGWLFSSGGAGWIFGVATILLYILRRKRPNRLVCKEVNRTLLIKIRKEVRDNIDVTFYKKPVKNLAMVQMVIFNQGSEVIKDILLTVKFLKDTKVLSVFSERDSEDLEMTTDPIESNQAKIKIPFLNPINPHKHRIKANILCDGDIQKYEVIGSGEGWSVQLFSIPNKKEIRKKLYIMCILLIIEALLLNFFYLPFVERHWGITNTEISLRSLLATLPFLFILSATFLWGQKYLYWFIGSAWLEGNG